MATLCETCAKAVPQLCQWINKGDRTGLEYKSKNSPYGDKKTYEVVIVISCPRYKPGPLPSIGMTEWR